MIRRKLATACILAAALTAFAAPGHAKDLRLVSRLYDANEVVRLEGKLSVQASIAFAEDEHIENVAIGDSNAWQITPNKRANLLFVKPLTARARTNMTVITDRHTYFFDLVADQSTTPIYVLRFTYPEVPKPEKPQMAAAEGMNAVEAQAIAQPAIDPADLNFAWATKGKPALLPSRIYDDGQATYLSWNAANPVPAILVQNEQGVEGPVNFAVRGDVIVVDGVPSLIVLRSGRNMATLQRQAKPSASRKAPPAAVEHPGPPSVLPSDQTPAVAIAAPSEGK